MREANEVDDISDDEDGDAHSSSCNLVEIILKLFEGCDSSCGSPESSWQSAPSDRGDLRQGLLHREALDLDQTCRTKQGPRSKAFRADNEVTSLDCGALGNAGECGGVETSNGNLEVCVVDLRGQLEGRSGCGRLDH